MGKKGDGDVVNTAEGKRLADVEQRDWSAAPSAGHALQVFVAFIFFGSILSVSFYSDAGALSPSRPLIWKLVGLKGGMGVDGGRYESKNEGGRRGETRGESDFTFSSVAVFPERNGRVDGAVFNRQVTPTSLKLMTGTTVEVQDEEVMTGLESLILTGEASVLQTRKLLQEPPASAVPSSPSPAVPSSPSPAMPSEPMVPSPAVPSETSGLLQPVIVEASQALSLAPNGTVLGNLTAMGAPPSTQDFNKSSLPENFNLSGLVPAGDQNALLQIVIQQANSPLVFGGKAFSDFNLPDFSFTENTSSKPFVRLAEKRTERPDPTHDFKKYTGGWDLRNSSYIASVAYTGAPAFIIAALWVLLAIVYLLAMCCYCCCCSRERHDGKIYEKSQYRWPLVFILVFTLTALAGCAILYTGGGRMTRDLADTIDFVISQANRTTTKMRVAADGLDEAKSLNVAGKGIQGKDQLKITDATTKIRNGANDVDKAVKDNKDSIKKVVSLIQVVLIVIVAVMAGVVLLGLVVSLVAWKPCVVILILISWMLIFFAWGLAGTFIVLMNLTGDTCRAMKDWTNEVSANTTLSDILPCVDEATANKALFSSKSTVLLGTALVNQAIGITNSVNYMMPPAPNVSLLCAAYTGPPQYNDSPISKCPKGYEANLQSYEEVWKNETCRNISGNACTNPSVTDISSASCFYSPCPDKRLTMPSYVKLVQTTYALAKMNTTTRMIVGLTRCDFAVETFTVIHDKYCPKLQDDAELQWIGLIILASSGMFLVFLWQLYVHRWRHRATGGKHMNKPIYVVTPPTY